MALELLIMAYDADDTAEAGTTTTNIKMTGHGLSTGDHIINSTRNSTPPDYAEIASRRVTVVDADNVTVVAVTGQTTGDTIKKFKHVDQVSKLLHESLSIRPQADYNGECTFTLVATTAYVPYTGQDVVIKNDGTVVYGGVIANVKRRKEPGTSTIFYDVTCMPYNTIPARRYTTSTYDATDSGTIVESMVDNILFQEGISKGTINTGATIAEYDAVCKSCKEVLDQQKDVSGYKWYINYDKQLSFLQEDSVSAAAHDLDNSTFTDFRDVEFEETLENYRNKQYVRGTLGDDGYVVQVNSTQASQVTARQNIEGNSGYYGDVLWDSNVDNETDAGIAGDNLIKKYGTDIPAKISFETGAVDFVSGTKLKVVLSNLGIAESYYLIEEVEIYDLDGVHLRSKVSATLRDSTDFSTQKSDGFAVYMADLIKVAKQGGTSAQALINNATKSHTNANAAAVTVNTSETVVATKTFTLWVKSDIFIAFSATGATGDALQLTAKTYITEPGGAAAARTYQPKEDYAGANDYLFSYTDMAVGIAAGEVTVSVKMVTDTSTYTVPLGFGVLSIITIPSLGLEAPPAEPTDGYIMGGYGSYLKDCDQFTQGTNTWTNKTDMPDPGRYVGAASAISSKIYHFMGGSSGDRLVDTDEFDPSGDSWASKADGTKAQEHAASSILNKAYTYAGENLGYIQTCNQYVPNTWTNKSNLPNPERSGLSAVTISNKGYVFCGITAGSTPMQDTEAYEPVGNSWTSKTDAPSPARFEHCSFALSLKAYIVNGYIAGGSTMLQDCDQYDPSGDSWTSKTDCPSPTRAYSSGFNCDGKGHIACGFSGGGIQDCDQYNAESDAWTSKNDAPTPARWGAAAASL